MVQVRFQAPTLTPIDALRLAVERYGAGCGIDPGTTVDSLASERDQNFLLTTKAGDAYVLKISHADESRDALKLQEQVLDVLAARVPQLQLPRLIPTPSGQTLTVAPGLDGAEHFVRLVSYVPGRVWAEAGPHSAALLRSLGCALAFLDAALADVDPAHAPGDLKWDLTRAHWITRYFQHLPPGRRELVTRLFEPYQTDVSRRLSRTDDRATRFPSGLLYNDANDHNVLVADGRVSGVIDFGDMVHGPRICDLAIGIAYAAMGSTAPLQAAASVVAGYHGVSPLTDDELEVLFPLVSARLCVSVTNAAYQLHAAPDNAYLQVSTTPAWRLLETFDRVSPQLALSTFRSACGLDLHATETAADIAAVRTPHLGRNLSVAYQRPLHIVRGRFQYLYDADGREYLDAVNNVAHVGHCHPRVVQAGQRQMAVLNTNSRYLHEHITQYAARLSATLPDPLSVCFFVNSGSEAGELALRLARAHTRSDATVVIDGAYHGNTAALVNISPYKYDGRGGAGQPPYVRKIPMPDSYRAPQGPEHILAAITSLEATGRRRPAFVAESMMGSSGQIILPAGFLPAAYGHIRDAGGVCIADEVQVGFGRAGTHFWGFQTQSVIPDIVIMGKPIGNGHPMGAVVTTPDIAASFDNGMEYFSTFGGNPVSCAIGLAVLDVLEDEGLQEHARLVGKYLRQGFRELAARHPLIGDVRGLGLFVGVEFVRDRESLEPAPSQTTYVCNRLKELGVLVSVDGPLQNVLKIKPPMVFTSADADYFVEVLDRILSERAALP